MHEGPQDGESSALGGHALGRQGDADFVRHGDQKHGERLAPGAFVHLMLSRIHPCLGKDRRLRSFAARPRRPTQASFRISLMFRRLRMKDHACALLGSLRSAPQDAGTLSGVVWTPCLVQTLLRALASNTDGSEEKCTSRFVLDLWVISFERL